MTSHLTATHQNFCVLLTTLAASGVVTHPSMAWSQELPPETSSFEALTPGQQAHLSLLGERIELALEEERYEHALATIAEAEAILPHPNLLLLRASALEGLGQYPLARSAIEDFLALRPEHERAQELKVKLQDLQNRQNSLHGQPNAGSLTIESEPPGAYVEFRDRAGKLKGSTPTVAIPVTRETTFYLLISRTGYVTQERTVEVKPGEHRTLHVTLKQRAPAPDTHMAREASSREARRKESASRGALPWVLWGMGLSGVGGMLVTEHRIQQLESMAPLDSAEQRQLDRARGLFVTSTIVAVAGSIGGTLVWIARAPSEPGLTTSSRESRRQLVLGPGWLSLSF